MAIAATPSSGTPSATNEPPRVASANSSSPTVANKQQASSQEGLLPVDGGRRWYRVSQYVLAGAGALTLAFMLGRFQGYYTGRADGLEPGIKLGNATGYALGLTREKDALTKLQTIFQLATMNTTDVERGVHEVGALLQQVKFAEGQRGDFEACKVGANNKASDLKVCQEKYDDQKDARFEQLNQKQREFDNQLAAEREASAKCREELNSLKSGGVFSAIWGVFYKILS